MPCDTINRVGLAMPNVDPTILAAALKAAGYTATIAGKMVSFYKGAVSGTYQNGKIDMRASRMGGAASIDDATNEIRRAYSAEVVRMSARRFGASVTQDPNNPNKMMLRLKSGR